MWNMFKWLTIASCLTSMASYLYCNNVVNVIKVPKYRSLLWIEPTQPENIFFSESYILNNSACHIPNYAIAIKSNERKYLNITCGRREIFIEKMPRNKIKFNIVETMLEPYLACCYQFANRPSDNDTYLNFDECKKFGHETITDLSSEIILVKCFNYLAKNKLFYRDHFIILKEVNATKNKSDMKDKWNILIFGMDTMSRDRIYRTMPRTVQYLKLNKWLEFKGYHKVGSNTFPNLMAILTGEEVSSIKKQCKGPPSGNKTMSVCNHRMLWSTYKKNGYITAYGEDYLRCPDTFSYTKGFETPPTDHYMRPFFLLGETVVGNFVCSGKVPSAIQMLRYAEQFALTYQKQGFFGFFWSNSYSHHLKFLPSLLDNEVVKFFQNLQNSGLLDDTFVIFLSDHGTRFGPSRIDFVESFYAERLPMLFIKVPSKFQKEYAEYYDKMTINQNRLTTPYDLHKTLLDILKLSSNNLIESSCGAGSDCTSLFKEISESRTCSDAMVNIQWCACVNLTEKSKDSYSIMRSVDVATEALQNRIRNIKPQNCTSCLMQSIDKILRTHMYKIGNVTFYIIAYKTKPSSYTYESLIETYDEKNFEQISISVLNSYNLHRVCIDTEDKYFCDCQIAECQ